MRRFKIYSFLLLIVSALLFVAFRVYSGMIVDNTPPVVTCAKEEITVPAEITEEELLKNVKAEDKRSGDVSDTLVVENLSAFTKEGKRIATYAAVDESKNVGRCTQTITYEGYKVPEFDMTSSLCFPTGQEVNLLAPITAHSVLDGSLTANIKYSLDEIINTMSPGNYPIEYRVMDSGGKVVYLNTYVEIYDTDYNGINVQLKDYLIYLKKGAAFDASEYYGGADMAGELKIKSNVKTKEAGTYYADYIVSSGSLKGKARLVVVVE